MKFKLLFLSFIFLFTACTPSNSNNPNMQDPTAFEKSYWFINDKLKLERTDNNFEQFEDPQAVIVKFNTQLKEKYQMDAEDPYYLPAPQITFKKIEGNTLYVKLENAEYVTQRMGSAGANEFMALATFSLTDIKGVQFVDFEFEEGDHARPGKYSRDSGEFKELL